MAKPNGARNGAPEKCLEQKRRAELLVAAKAAVEKDGLLATAARFQVHPQTLKSFVAGCSVHRGTVLAIAAGLKA